MIKKVKFDHFTGFKDLSLDLSPGVNVLVGENGTGKTHILKTIYALTGFKRGESLAQRLIEVFLPSARQLGRLIYRQKISCVGSIAMTRPIGKTEKTLTISFSNHAKTPDSAKVRGITNWSDYPLEVVYIPVKEMLASAPGFRSLVTNREAHFEKIYVDIVDKALLPLRKGPIDTDRKTILKILQQAMKGKVVVQEEEFFLSSSRGKIEFTLLAEGLRKLGLLWVLLQNGTLLKGSVLCWDEPEANLNPSLFRHIVEILLKLQHMGVQIVLSTHSYALLKEFDLQTTTTTDLRYHALYRDDDDNIRVNSVDEFVGIDPNAITQTFNDLYDRDVDRALGTEE